MTGAHLQWTIGDVVITRVEEVLTYIDATVLMPDFDVGQNARAQLLL